MPTDLKILLLFFVSRIWTFLFVYLGHFHREYLAPVPYGWKGVSNWILNPWTTYDSIWYMEIARIGYRALTTSFFPLYPFLLRFAGSNEISTALWGMLISNISFAAALLIFYRLTRLDLDEKSGWTALFLLVFYPTTCFFSAVYTESLFLLLLVAAFYFARKKSWKAAGCFAFFAALQRNAGVAIFAALAIEYFKNPSSCHPRGSGDPNGFPIKTFGNDKKSIFLPLIAFLFVEGYFAIRFGNLFAGLDSQGNYFRALSWPWVPVMADVINLFVPRPVTILSFLEPAAAIYVFVLLFKYWKRIPVSYVLLTASVFLMHLSYCRQIPPYTSSSLRYASTLFPVMQLFARDVNGGKKFFIFLAAGSYLALSALLSYKFGMKNFLG